MGAKVLKENAAATQASRIMQMKSIVEKSHKIRMKRKAAFENDVFSLFPLYFEREMASGFIQALSGT